MKKMKISIIIITMVGALALTSCGKTTATTVKKPVAKQTANMVDASGTVQSSNVESINLNFGAEASPIITKINVQQGQPVKKGEKLATLDMTIYNYTITSKQRAIDADIDTKSSLQTDDQKKVQQDKIDSEEAELNALKAMPNENHISGNNVVSDIDNAVVTDVSGNSATVSSAGASGIATIADLNSLYVQAKVSEEFINSVSVGKPVEIIPTSDPNAKLSGKITSIASTAVLDKNGDTYIPVNISIDQNNGKLFPNYNVDVQISK
ncbi:efflux RND transporter periplasmic adaptor subunit [Clostridium akagii]|uniref:efflux RND transporter periplasmic adaptor subunit n=1 Tax=Clostridium akagii TaxID=91623 RepID=UPI0004797C97|nr:HlyD family efflux transporter periplasmic adaptor subunit [Clostridium akagii]